MWQSRRILEPEITLNHRTSDYEELSENAKKRYNTGMGDCDTLLVCGSVIQYENGGL